MIASVVGGDQLFPNGHLITTLRDAAVKPTLRVGHSHTGSEHYCVS